MSRWTESGGHQDACYLCARATVALLWTTVAEQREYSIPCCFRCRWTYDLAPPKAEPPPPAPTPKTHSGDHSWTSYPLYEPLT